MKEIMFTFRCKKCGGINVSIREINDGDAEERMFYCRCDKCGRCSTPTKSYYWPGSVRRGIAKAVKQWNEENKKQPSD